ncbi:MAG: hypothetical protein H6716_26950 [Polyangiaceae bacterium]|nr:hypothetical protein [Polyangiaceae bacterium]
MEHRTLEFRRAQAELRGVRNHRLAGLRFHRGVEALGERLDLLRRPSRRRGLLAALVDFAGRLLGFDRVVFESVAASASRSCASYAGVDQGPTEA